MKRASLLVAFVILLSALPWAVAQHAPDSHGAEAASGEAKPAAHGDSGIGWKWANFAILVGVLGYFISKKAGAFFASRTDSIQKGILEAARLRKNAEARAAEIERRLSDLSAEIEALRRSARDEMESEGRRIRRETEEALRKLQLQTEQEVVSAAMAARHELKAFSASLAIDTARHRILTLLTPQVQDTLVRSFVSGIQTHSTRTGGEEAR